MQDQGNPAATGLVARRFLVDRWFYIVMAICAIVTIFLGFAPSLINTAARKAPPSSLAIAHGLVSAAWLLIFLVQTTLVATRRIPVHSQLGTAAVFLAPVIIVLGYMTAITMARRGFDLSGDLHIEADPLLGMVNPLGDLVPFGILVAAGFLYRHQSDIHKRLMLLATVGGLMLDACTPRPLHRSFSKSQQDAADYRGSHCALSIRECRVRSPFIWTHPSGLLVGSGGNLRVGPLA
jgi:hypothetical protein